MNLEYSNPNHLDVDFVLMKNMAYLGLHHPVFVLRINCDHLFAQRGHLNICRLKEGGALNLRRRKALKIDP